ncbi:hypothetical protein ACTMTJ_37115 [Phytohabitans sp. LJ34]|uniref:hypothetical protein n=1 Tax=Phytohabitans sp. LJ34 TaxID=3452217 RepID=UPI003F891D16
MSAKLTRRLAASAVVAGMVLAGTATPARAEVVPAPPPAGPVITVVISISSFFEEEEEELSAQEVALLIRESIGAIDTARAEVQQHLDARIAADVNVTLAAARIEMLDYAAWRDDEIALWENARKFNTWANNASAYLGAVQSRAAEDKLGLAVNTLYPLAVMLRVDAGAVNGARELLRDQIDINRWLVDRLAPACHQTQQHYECVGYDGTTVREAEPTTEEKKQEIKFRAGQHTSWAVATRVLPELERALAEL